MNKVLVCSLMLLMGGAAHGMSTPSNSAIKYHGSQFLAGALAGVVTEKIFDIKGMNMRGSLAKNLMKYGSIAVVPGALDKTVLQSSVAQQPADTKRWAYLVGLEASYSLFRCLYH